MKDAVDGVVDSSWEVLTDEIKYNLQLKLAEPYVEIQKEEHFCLFLPIIWLRNQFRYAMYPVDKSIWKQLKTFSWWFFTLVSSIPYFGV